MRQVCALLLLTMCCAAQTPVPQTSYQDPQTGVSFKYPSVWVSSDKSPSYFAPAFSAPDSQPRASFTFSPIGNLYEKTVLSSLVFSYFTVAASSEASCVQRALAATSQAKSSVVMFHGVRFRDIQGGNAGMCHTQASQIDVSYRQGQCLVFERDFNTECFGSGDGKRKLTAQETKALQRHLDDAMNSVTLVP